MQVRLKRIKARPGAPDELSVSRKYLHGFMPTFPMRGESFMLYLDKLGRTYWITSPVHDWTWKKGKIIFTTLNSDYELRCGWK